MFYYLCKCIACPGGNKTEPAVEAMFRAGMLSQAWNDHASLTSLVVAKYNEKDPHECMTPLKDRDAALTWLVGVDAGAPVSYRAPEDPAKLVRMTARTSVEDILSRHEEGM